MYGNFLLGTLMHGKFWPIGMAGEIMTATKLKPNTEDYESYLRERLGELGEAPNLWLPQVQKYGALGFVEIEFLLHIFTNISMVTTARKHRIYPIAKRIIDLTLGILTLPLAIPLFGVIALAIKLDSKGPIFFKQTRIGKFGIPFSILKFRTMYEKSEAQLERINSTNSGNFFKVRNDPRITRVGKFLRRWSLDETPQLINIIRGDMTLIGPRPLPVYDVAAIPYRHMDRFSVTPGLSGLWQVTARDSTDGRKNLQIDSEYVKKFGPVIDLWILMKTPGVVIKGTGAH
jgi:lipopolysaccharide/colanic/teichoic acid biosynthesis glycosyltransferase